MIAAVAYITPVCNTRSRSTRCIDLIWRNAMTQERQNANHAQLTCRVIRPDDAYAGRQGLTYFAGVSAETTGAHGICMHLVRIPPGARANAHVHEQHETAIYVLSGEVEMWCGERLEQHMTVRAGEFVYIPAGIPHQPFNATATEAVAVLARTDPNEQESVVLLPELDELHR